MSDSPFYKVDLEDIVCMLCVTAIIIVCLVTGQC
jgi:hypothetical protein